MVVVLEVQVQLRAKEGWVEGENCLVKSFPWKAVKNEMRPVEFSMAVCIIVSDAHFGFVL